LSFSFTTPKMYQNEVKKLQIANKFNEYYYHVLKRTLQFVISIFVFSLLLWYSSGFSFFPYSFNFYFFSTTIFSVFTNTFQRKYMFLICNAILVFLAKTSVCSATFGSQKIVPMENIVSPENVPSIAEEEEEEKLEQQQEAKHEEKQDGTSCMETEERGNEAPTVEEDGALAKQGQEDEVGTEISGSEELANADELNRKFEEFIRKMKEEIRIEAQR
ncbi:Transmembrane protein, partial [Quillaja saponaria]